jgi:hypothetical protein
MEHGTPKYSFCARTDVNKYSLLRGVYIRQITVPIIRGGAKAVRKDALLLANDNLTYDWELAYESNADHQ